MLQTGSWPNANHGKNGPHITTGERAQQLADSRRYVPRNPAEKPCCAEKRVPAWKGPRANLENEV